MACIAHALCRPRRTIAGRFTHLRGEDSVDVWAYREGFQADASGQFLQVAGVPPDPYCEDGQRWGNPLYDWDAMAETGFDWWIRRVRRAFRLTDSVRIDHFIGMCRYWSIPADAETARDGIWRDGPGQALFDALTHALGSLSLVVEDLGPIDANTRALQQHLTMPGMRVVQFGFGSGPNNEHLPENAPELSLLYTSTHDSDTTRGWWDGLSPALRAEVAPKDPNHPVDALIQRVLASPAIWAMVPIQDWLGADSTARFNTPGTTHGNWRWRVHGTQLTQTLAERIHQTLSTTRRGHPGSHQQQPFTLTASHPMQSSSTASPSIAYFCMEFGLHQEFPIYAGGLGVLAGDILKAAGDQQRPFVGAGIFWNHGYTVQTLDDTGTPVDTFIPTSRAVLEPTGVETTVTIRGKDVPITAHRVTAFNNATLYLLEPIHPDDQWVSKWLYGGSDDDRVAQEVLLGIGGVRVLQAMDTL